MVTEGDTREEAMANAREAIEAILEVYRDEGWEIPNDVKTEGLPIEEFIALL